MREGFAARYDLGSVDYDFELRKLNEVLRSSYDFRPGHRILDIGCGAGQTSRDAARLATSGTVLGVDVSAPMIERARRLAEAEGLRNVTFEQGDAQRYPFTDGIFDVAISRFGTMFFGDPIAAFSNIARAVRPGGRLQMMVWQSRHQNEWAVAIHQVMENGASSPDSSRAPDAFSLGDPDATASILDSAGFADATFTDVHEPVYYGPDVDAAFEWVSGFSTVNLVLQKLDAASVTRARDRLRQTLAAHAGDDGVWFDSRAWIVAARRR